MEHINYSIIIPHKNSPKLLQRCLNSIPRRNDIQIIVVDDNSDTDKVDFEHFPGMGEQCVEVYFTKEGKGAGYARNVGLSKAKGKWLLFADADDYYVDGFIDTLDVHVNGTYDIIYFNTLCRNEKNEEYPIYVTNIFNGYLSGKLTEEDIKFGIWVPWNKMFSSSFINKYEIKFEEISVGNDALFSLNASEYSSNIFILKDKLYCYNINPDSITFRKRDFQREILYLDVNLRINKFLREKKHPKYQLAIITPKIIITKLKKYGLYKTIQYLSYIMENDSLLSNIGVYFNKKFNKS